MDESPEKGESAGQEEAKELPYWVVLALGVAWFAGLAVLWVFGKRMALWLQVLLVVVLIITTPGITDLLPGAKRGARSQARSK